MIALQLNRDLKGLNTFASQAATNAMIVRHYSKDSEFFHGDERPYRHFRLCANLFALVAFPQTVTVGEGASHVDQSRAPHQLKSARVEPTLFRCLVVTQNYGEAR